MKQAHAQVVWDDGVGPRQQVLATHPLKPSEYKDSLTTLAERYPEPVIKDDD